MKKHIIEDIARESCEQKYDYVFVEAALLIEDHYDVICDELWYIYTAKDVRRARLKSSRGYSDAKIDAIFASQLSEETYRKYCKVVIDNNDSLEKSFEQLRQIFAEMGISALVK